MLLAEAWSSVGRLGLCVDQMAEEAKRLDRGLLLFEMRPSRPCFQPQQSYRP